MPSQIHRQASELLLASMFTQSETGSRASFMYARPGQPQWSGNTGTELFYERREFVRAILYMRKHGAPYLRFLSVGDIWSLLTSFVSSNYGYISGEAWARKFNGSYGANLSEAAKPASPRPWRCLPYFIRKMP